MKNIYGITWKGALVAALVTLLFAPVAAAQGWRTEAFAGWYNPDGNVSDDDVPLGFRLGYDVNEKFGIDFTGEFFDSKLEEFSSSQQRTHYNIDLRTWEVSFIWYPTGKGFYLLGGPGLTTVDYDIRFPEIGVRIDGDESIFNFHAGLGYLWKLENGFYMRPDIRARWQNQDFEHEDFTDQEYNYDNVDFGMYLGFGYSF